MTTAAPTAAAAPGKGRVSWGTRLLATLGFLLAAAFGALYLSQQVAIERARDYARTRYKVNLDIPIRGARPDLVGDDAEIVGEPPPLGFCWTIEIEAGVTSGEVLVNPWTHEVVGWRAPL